MVSILELISDWDVRYGVLPDETLIDIQIGHDVDKLQKLYEKCEYYYTRIISYPNTVYAVRLGVLISLPSLVLRYINLITSHDVDALASDIVSGIILTHTEIAQFISCRSTTRIPVKIRSHMWLAAANGNLNYITNTVDDWGAFIKTDGYQQALHGACYGCQSIVFNFIMNMTKKIIKERIPGINPRLYLCRFMIDNIQSVIEMHTWPHALDVCPQYQYLRELVRKGNLSL